MRRSLTAGTCLALCALGVASPLVAQQDSALVQAVRRATEGLGDSARALVRSRLRAIPRSDSVYAEALFTAGVVAANTDSATYYFRQVSIDFSQSSWADDALLRLAQLAFAAGDLAGAQRTVDRLLNDYPQSDVRPQANYWSGRVLLEQGDAGRACQRLAAARDAAAANVELANQVAFYLQRCTALANGQPAGAPAAARPDSTKHDSTKAAPAAPNAATFFAVQVAAVRTAAAADDLMRSLKTQGYTARVSRDPDGLFKVRVGHYPTKAEAERLAREVKRKVGGNPFVVEEQ
jgi:cell division septation protein DedD